MSETTRDVEPVKILWTGGWDSTFQLLRLVLEDRRHVQPYYLVSKGRPSAETELLTMQRIRAAMGEIDSSVSELLFPTKCFPVSEIPESAEVASAYEDILSRSFIGSQYDWLSRFCQNQGIRGLQLCVHEDDKASLVIREKVIPTESNAGSFVVDDKYSETSEYAIFGYFEFPILKLTKIDMAKISKERGWSEIMEMTWFCHTPVDGEPCAACAPCKYTIEEGLARRIPARRRFKERVKEALSGPVGTPVKEVLSFLLRKLRPQA